MVNSGSYESDSDRNTTDGYIQANNTSESSQSPSQVPVSGAALCKNDFSQTPDTSGLPSVADAIEPTPTKTEFNSSMPTAENHSYTSPVEAALDTRCEAKTGTASDDEKTSLCCSVPLDKVQGILSPYGSASSAPKTDAVDSDVKVKQNSRKLLCLYCERTFVSPNLRQKHVERCHSSKPNRRISSRRQQNQLTTTPCIYCDKLTSTEHTLKQLFEHLVSEHSSKYFACLACEDRFLSNSFLVEHNASIHATIQPQNAFRQVSVVLEKDIIPSPVTFKEEDPLALPSLPDDDVKDDIITKLDTKVASEVEEKPKIDSEDIEESPPRLIRTKKDVNWQGSSSEQENVPVKITRSKVKMSTGLQSGENQAIQLRDAKKKQQNLRQLRSRKMTVKTSKISQKRISKRLQAKIAESQKKKRSRQTEKRASNAAAKSEPVSSTKTGEKTPKTNSGCINPYPEFDSFYRVKKITDHSIDNLKISSLKFDDVFDKAFFNRIQCNIQENLLHHIDGKLFKNEESESRISNFEKVSSATQEVQSSNAENYGCELSLNAVTPVASLLTPAHFGEDPESQIEYGSKPSKKKITTTTQNEVHYKYFTRRKYQASIMEQKENRDLSKLDMWTQLIIKSRQQKMADTNKTARELQEYTLGLEYKTRIKREELNRILDRRGPFEDLKEEATKKAALDKLNSDSDDRISEESFSDVREILSDLLTRVFDEVTEEPTEVPQAQETVVVKPPRSYDQEGQVVEIPSYLNLRRSSSLPSEGEIDKSDKIALICSSQETEYYELPSNSVREKNEMIELTGEWARCRIYICAACGTRVPNMKQLLEHKNIYHQYVWTQHYEFVGNQSELYRHLSIPGLGKVGLVEDISRTSAWRRSDARVCLKCGRQCNALGDLHRHMLECGGDWSWMLARKKCKYRPFGAKSRRKRRGLVKRIHVQKSERPEKKTYKKRFEGPRQRPSDADSIQRMLANLPAKRATRKIMSLKDGFQRNYQPHSSIIPQNKMKCGKIIVRNSNIRSNANLNKKTNTLPPNKNQIGNYKNNRRSLRCLNKVLASRILDTNTNLLMKRKLKNLNNRRITRQISRKIDTSLESKESSIIDKTNNSDNKLVRKSSLKSNKAKDDNKDAEKKDELKIKRPAQKTEEEEKTNDGTSAKKVVQGKLNIKSFFPVKKKKKALSDEKLTNSSENSSKSSENASQGQKSKEDKTSEVENKKEEFKINTKKKNDKVESKKVEKKSEEKKQNEIKASGKSAVLKTGRDVKEVTKTTPKEVEEVQAKKLKSQSFGSLVRNLSLRKRKLMKQEEKRNDEASDKPDETAEVEKTVKRRKLKQRIKNVVNMVRKRKTTKTTDNGVLVNDNKLPDDGTGLKPQESTGHFLGKGNVEDTPPIEKIVIPSTSEKSENIADISVLAPIVINSNSSNVEPQVLETIFNLQSNNEKNLQAKGELNFDTNAEKAEESKSEEYEDISKPISVNTALNPSISPMVSPSMKGKIRKPAKRLNDCIAMLTSKLQQKEQAAANNVSTPLPPDNIMDIETPPATTTFSSYCQEKTLPVQEECVALDLSIKSSRHRDLETLTQEINKPLTKSASFSTIDKIIQEVIDRSTSPLKWPEPKPVHKNDDFKRWTSVDDIIQRVIENKCEETILNVPVPKLSKTSSWSVNDIIEYVASGKDLENVDINKQILTDCSKNGISIINRKEVCKIGSIRKGKAFRTNKTVINLENSASPAEEAKKKSVHVPAIEKNALEANKLEDVLISESTSVENANIDPLKIPPIIKTINIVPTPRKIGKTRIKKKLKSESPITAKKPNEEPKTDKLETAKFDKTADKTNEAASFIETNIDNLLHIKEVNIIENKESTVPQTVCDKQKDRKRTQEITFQLTEENEPIQLENKTVTTQLENKISQFANRSLTEKESDSEDEIPLAILKKEGVERKFEQPLPTESVQPEQNTDASEEMTNISKPVTVDEKKKKQNANLKQKQKLTKSNSSIDKIMETIEKVIEEGMTTNSLNVDDSPVKTFENCAETNVTIETNVDAKVNVFSSDKTKTDNLETDKAQLQENINTDADVTKENSKKIVDESPQENITQQEPSTQDVNEPSESNSPVLVNKCNKNKLQEVKSPSKRGRKKKTFTVKVKSLIGVLRRKCSTRNKNKIDSKAEEEAENAELNSELASSNSKISVVETETLDVETEMLDVETEMLDVEKESASSVIEKTYTPSDDSDFIDVKKDTTENLTESSKDISSKDGSKSKFAISKKENQQKISEEQKDTDIIAKRNKTEVVVKQSETEKPSELKVIGTLGELEVIEKQVQPQNVQKPSKEEIIEADVVDGIVSNTHNESDLFDDQVIKNNKVTNKLIVNRLNFTKTKGKRKQRRKKKITPKNNKGISIMKADHDLNVLETNVDARKDTETDSAPLNTDKFPSSENVPLDTEVSCKKCLSSEELKVTEIAEPVAETHKLLDTKRPLIRRPQRKSNVRKKTLKPELLPTSEVLNEDHIDNVHIEATASIKNDMINNKTDAEVTEATNKKGKEVTRSKIILKPSTLKYDLPPPLPPSTFTVEQKIGIQILEPIKQTATFSDMKIGILPKDQAIEIIPKPIKINEAKLDSSVNNDEIINKERKGTSELKIILKESPSRKKKEKFVIVNSITDMDEEKANKIPPSTEACETNSIKDKTTVQVKNPIPKIKLKLKQVLSKKSASKHGKKKKGFKSRYVEKLVISKNKVANSEHNKTAMSTVSSNTNEIIENEDLDVSQLPLGNEVKEDLSDVSRSDVDNIPPTEEANEINESCVTNEDGKINDLQPPENTNVLCQFNKIDKVIKRNKKTKKSLSPKINKPNKALNEIKITETTTEYVNDSNVSTNIYLEITESSKQDLVSTESNILTTPKRIKKQKPESVEIDIPSIIKTDDVSITLEEVAKPSGKKVITKQSRKKFNRKNMSVDNLPSLISENESDASLNSSVDNASLKIHTLRKSRSSSSIIDTNSNKEGDSSIVQDTPTEEVAEKQKSPKRKSRKPTKSTVLSEEIIYVSKQSEATVSYSKSEEKIVSNLSSCGMETSANKKTPVLDDDFALLTENLKEVEEVTQTEIPGENHEPTKNSESQILSIEATVANKDKVEVKKPKQATRKVAKKTPPARRNHNKPETENNHLDTNLTAGTVKLALSGGTDTLKTKPKRKCRQSNKIIEPIQEGVKENDKSDLAELKIDDSIYTFSEEDIDNVATKKLKRAKKLLEFNDNADIDSGLEETPARTVETENKAEVVINDEVPLNSKLSTERDMPVDGINLDFVSTKRPNKRRNNRKTASLGVTKGSPKKVEDSSLESVATQNNDKVTVNKAVDNIAAIFSGNNREINNELLPDISNDCPPNLTPKESKEVINDMSLSEDEMVVDSQNESLEIPKTRGLDEQNQKKESRAPICDVTSSDNDMSSPEGSLVTKIKLRNRKINKSFKIDTSADETSENDNGDDFVRPRSRKSKLAAKERLLQCTELINSDHVEVDDMDDCVPHNVDIEQAKSDSTLETNDDAQNTDTKNESEFVKPSVRTRHRPPRNKTTPEIKTSTVDNQDILDIESCENESNKTVKTKVNNGRKVNRKAKAKALEHILDEALSELSESDNNSDLLYGAIKSDNILPYELEENVMRMESAEYEPSLPSEDKYDSPQKIEMSLPTGNPQTEELDGEVKLTDELDQSGQFEDTTLLLKPVKTLRKSKSQKRSAKKTSKITSEEAPCDEVDFAVLDEHKDQIKENNSSDILTDHNDMHEDSSQIDLNDENELETQEEFQNETGDLNSGSHENTDIQKDNQPLDNQVLSSILFKDSKLGNTDNRPTTGRRKNKNKSQKSKDALSLPTAMSDTSHSNPDLRTLENESVSLLTASDIETKDTCENSSIDGFPNNSFTQFEEISENSISIDYSPPKKVSNKRKTAKNKSKSKIRLREPLDLEIQDSTTLLGPNLDSQSLSGKTQDGLTICSDFPQEAAHVVQEFETLPESDSSSMIPQTIISNQNEVPPQTICLNRNISKTPLISDAFKENPYEFESDDPETSINSNIEVVLGKTKTRSKRKVKSHKTIPSKAVKNDSETTNSSVISDMSLALSDKDLMEKNEMQETLTQSQAETSVIKKSPEEPVTNGKEIGSLINLNLNHQAEDFEGFQTDHEQKDFASSEVSNPEINFVKPKRAKSGNRKKSQKESNVLDDCINSPTLTGTSALTKNSDVNEKSCDMLSSDTSNVVDEFEKPLPISKGRSRSLKADLEESKLDTVATNDQDVETGQEVRRSRRATRKICSYNENEIESAMLEIEKQLLVEKPKKKEKSQKSIETISDEQIEVADMVIETMDHTPMIHENKIAILTQDKPIPILISSSNLQNDNIEANKPQRKLNSDELFDLLKKSSEKENTNFRKPHTARLPSYDEISDFSSDTNNFDNVFEDILDIQDNTDVERTPNDRRNSSENLFEFSKDSVYKTDNIRKEVISNELIPNEISKNDDETPNKDTALSEKSTANVLDNSVPAVKEPIVSTLGELNTEENVVTSEDNLVSFEEQTNTKQKSDDFDNTSSSFISAEFTDNSTEKGKSNLKVKIKTRTNKSQESVDVEDCYCEICNKSFRRPENLIKHKRTLTHISKLSELEAKETQNRIAEENKTEDTSKSNNISEETSTRSRNDINITNILQASDKPEERSESETLIASSYSVNTNNHSLKLADIINDVLNKPVLDRDSGNHNNFSDIILQNSTDIQQPEFRRYKSLGERKSFDSEPSENISHKVNMEPTYFTPEMSDNTEKVEKQITLLQNMIEKTQALNYIDDISVSSSQSAIDLARDSPSLSVASSRQDDSNNITFSNSNATNSINKAVMNDNSFIKPNQYEEISEDSTHIRYEDQKSRKVLNRDEELFLECCSLLKSGSEMSNYSKKSHKLSIIHHHGLKTSDEPEWMENKRLSQKQIYEDRYSDNSRIPTPLGDNYNDDMSNSNTISTNWHTNKKECGSDENKDINLGKDDENRSFVFQEEESSTAKSLQEDDLPEKSKFSSISKTFLSISQSVAKTFKGCKDEDKKSVGDNDGPDMSEKLNDVSYDTKKIITKGAKKEFEGLKVSIPTEELNLSGVLSYSPTLKATEKKLEQTETVDDIGFSVPTKDNIIACKSADKSNISKDKLQHGTEKCGLKSTKKKVNSKPVRKKKTGLVRNSDESDSKAVDVYDFEETQDNSDVFTKPDFRSFRNKKSDDNSTPKDLNVESDNDSQASLSFEAKSVSSVSSVSSTPVKKPKNQPVTKKKCMIMGRIFKNAVKSKVEEDIRHIPVMDNVELVNNYVMNCPEVSSPNTSKKQPEDADVLFDQLLENNKLEIGNVKELPAKGKVENKATYNIKKKNIKMNKNRKRSRLNSDSTDDEFSLNKTKKRINRKNPKVEDNCINLEQELKECIGVASRKSQRKCTSGKQNVLVEYWSSDDSSFEALLESQVIPSETCKSKPTEKEAEIPVDVQVEQPDAQFENSEVLTTKLSEPLPVESDHVEQKQQKPRKSKSTDKKLVKKPRVDTEFRKPINVEQTAETLASSRRKRAAADPLYHWSSSSEDESQDLIEVKPIRDELDDDEDRPVQHGWIVGDSPKKLVTMLAQAKGKKTDTECVKEQSKKRTANSTS